MLQVLFSPAHIITCQSPWRLELNITITVAITTQNELLWKGLLMHTVKTDFLSTSNIGLNLKKKKYCLHAAAVLSASGSGPGQKNGPTKEEHELSVRFAFSQSLLGAWKEVQTLPTRSESDQKLKRKQLELQYSRCVGSALRCHSSANETTVETFSTDFLALAEQPRYR
ncbi:uncharacterized protein V6R79_006918 [Siganus canaliculatus]